MELVSSNLREKDWILVLTTSGRKLELVWTTSGRRIRISIDHLREKD